MARCYFLFCFSNKYQQFLWRLHDPSDTRDTSERLQRLILGWGFFFLPSLLLTTRSVAVSVSGVDYIGEKRVSLLYLRAMKAVIDRRLPV